MSAGPADIAQVAQHLQHAVGHLLVAQVHLGLDQDVHVPTDALDQSLGRSQTGQEARRVVLQALEALRSARGTQARQRAFYDAEAAINALVAVVLDEGFRVGWSSASAP